MHLNYSIMDREEHSLCGSVVQHQPLKLCGGGCESSLGFKWLVRIQFPIEARCQKMQNILFLGSLRCGRCGDRSFAFKEVVQYVHRNNEHIFCIAMDREI